MKLRNPKVWARISVTSTIQVRMGDAYRGGCEGRVPLTSHRHQYDWMEWESIPECVRNIPSGEKWPAFTASIVGYQIPDPSRNIKRGMDRRHALALLRKLGLEAPTAVQTIQLAAQIISNEERINTVLGLNPHQNIVCPTPINPEFPDFYYFGEGHEGKGSFRNMNYSRVSGEDNLYFWHHGDENRPKLELWRYHFPYILGIEPVKT